MRSGLWILLLVILAGIVVGTLLKGRLNEPEEIDDITVLRRISAVEDPEAKIEQLRQFLVDYPETEYESDAYYMIAGTMLNDQGDTSGMIAFAEETLDEVDDPETRAVMYYRLYRATAETQPNEAYMYAVKLRDSGLEVAWVYNYIAYDYAEKAKRLMLAATLADRAVEFAESAEDSSSYLDTRGWVHFMARDYEKALIDLEEAVRITPEPSPEILGHLARAQLKLGRSDEAFDTFRTVLVMGEYSDARENIAAIMDRKGYTGRQREAFESDLWAERMDRAETVDPFTLKTLDGSDFEYRPDASTLSIINFFSPT
ncbi:MAG: tetratricopeptide repeat protein [bacterium]|jgi:tetratricopeptide (TPR) repeat protein